MNKKQKMLTIVALVAFGAIILFHYCNWNIINYERPYKMYRHHTENGIETSYYLGSYRGRGLYIDYHPAISDVRMPLFVLAVFYTGLVFLLQNKRT